MDPRNPLIFHKFLIFFYTYFSNSLTIQAEFHEAAKYIILYSKIGLVQPSRSLIENKKIPSYEHGIKIITPW